MTGTVVIDNRRRGPRGDRRRHAASRPSRRRTTEPTPTAPARSPSPLRPARPSAPAITPTPPPNACAAAVAKTKQALKRAKRAYAKKHTKRNKKRVGEGEEGPQEGSEAVRAIICTARMFNKVLVANRGEIAVRVIRALDELGIGSVAVYSEADRDAQHVKRATEAYLIGPGPANQSYLVVEKLLEVIEESGAEAVHPGYGFLAENAKFARTLEDNGITFIGPPASAIDAMGSKTKARELMQDAGVPIVPGITEPVETVEDAEKIAEDIGYPIAVKAAGGGGGKGFRVAMKPENLKDAFEGAAREGEKFFSDDTVYLERYLEDPRHVEVQILADKHGNVIHLGERDCSIQRRHQKLIEESPGPLVDEEMREKIGKIGVDAAKAVDYHSAGTIEGLFVKQDDGPDEYFFLEMNTRVQVEHCVTEATTGIDIVREQILIAAGEELSIKQEDVAAARVRDRVPHQRRERRHELLPRAGHASPATASRRARASASTPACIARLGDHAAVRPDGRQADRLGLDARAGHQAHAARAGRVRGRGRHDADAVPQGDHGLRAVGQRRDLPRPDRGQGLAEVARARAAAGAADDDDVEIEERDLHRRGVRQALRGQGARRGVRARRGRRRRRGAGGGGRKAPKRGERKAAAAAAAPTSSNSPLQGNMWKVARRRGRRGRGGPAHLHHRGDEDGERDHRPQGRQDRRARRQGGRADQVRRPDRDDHVAAAADRDASRGDDDE